MSRSMPTLPNKGRQPCDLPPPKSSKSFWHSEPSPLLIGHRSTRKLPEKADVVIIGSGITGTSVAHHLLNSGSGISRSERGPSVVMLEAREACWGATGRNGGHCQPLLFEHPEDPSIGDFELANYNDLKKHIETHEIDCEWVSQPGVRAIYGHEKVEGAKKALATLETTAPHLVEMVKLVTDKEELAKYRIATADGAMVTSVAARLWPYKLVAHVLSSLLTSSSLAGRFNLQTLTPATSLCPASSGEGWAVSTPRGMIITPRVVLATNAYTSHLLPSFADLIVPCRGQMSALQPLPSLAGENRLKTSMGFEGDGLDDYLIQRPNERGGHLMFGGGRTSAPSLGVTDDSVVDIETATYLKRQLVDVFDLPEHEKPGQARVEFTATHMWTGIMGFSRDEVPWVGPVPDKPGCFIAAGFTGHGMPNTWLSGKAVAGMVKADLQGEEGVEEAKKETGLPEAYLVSEERVERCMRIMDVAIREQEEAERAARVKAEAS